MILPHLRDLDSVFSLLDAQLPEPFGVKSAELLAVSAVFVASDEVWLGFDHNLFLRSRGYNLRARSMSDFVDVVANNFLVIVLCSCEIKFSVFVLELTRLVVSCFLGLRGVDSPLIIFLL